MRLVRYSTNIGEPVEAYGDYPQLPPDANVIYLVMRYSVTMVTDDISAEDILNLILDKVDDMIVINDADMNIIWMNHAAQHKLGMSIEEVVGTKCYKLFGATCCCDNCAADHMFGGPHRYGCTFKCRNKTNEFDCEPVPYHKDGKLRIVVQHIRPVNKNE